MLKTILSINVSFPVFIFVFIQNKLCANQNAACAYDWNCLDDDLAPYFYICTFIYTKRRSVIDHLSDYRSILGRFGYAYTHAHILLYSRCFDSFPLN